MSDPSTCPRLSSCSTPNHQSSWSEVVVRGCRGYSDGAASPPRLSLSKHYVPLPNDTPVHPADAPVVPTHPDLDPPLKTAPAHTAASPVVTNSVGVACQSTVKPNPWPSSCLMTSSSRRKFLKEAVIRYSGVFCALSQQGNPFSTLLLLPHHNTRLLGHLILSQQLQHSMERDHAPSCHENPQPSSPHPLFSPATLIVGDNAATHCFPGATVPDILNKLSGLLCSLRSSAKR
eukprot:superscaffoldBa00000096_g1421